MKRNSMTFPRRFAGASVIALAAAVFTMALSAQRAGAATLVTTELSLVMDVSGSVGEAEYNLQRLGYRDAFLDMDVQIALKVVLAEYFPDASALTKFGHAIAPAQNMSHENIVRVYDMLPDESRFVIAQQLVLGRTLSEVLAERLPQGIPSPPSEVRTILTQIGNTAAGTFSAVSGGVDNQATGSRSVVAGIILIIVVDGILAVIFSILGI